MTDERRGGIRTTSEAAPAPFPYPGGARPVYSPAELTAAETWIANTGATGAAALLHVFGRSSDLDSKRNVAVYYEERARRQEAGVETFFQGLPQRPIPAIPAGSWDVQRNTDGMYTCQIASAINALRQLGLYDPANHTERRFIEELGGREFVAANRGGFEMRQLIPALQQLAPHIRVRRSNSVLEMLSAGEHGAAVMYPFSNGHEALIPPGRRMRRNQTDGQLEVQIINSLYGSRNIDFVKVANLVRSEITLADTPGVDHQENNVLIIERARQPIQTVRVGTDTRVPIRTVSSRVPIRTLAPAPGIRTSEVRRSPIQTTNQTPRIRSRKNN